MSQIEINEQFSRVLDFINRTQQLIFLTGKAGTGKTTLLKYIRENTYKQLAVVAPTGVAAINAGGSTIHSFFQFPFSPFLPVLNESGQSDPSRSKLPTLKYSSQRLAIFRSLELLIIDEISMVRCDLLDQIDLTLRFTRKRSHLPFGGVQVLFIGDMYQLSPVVGNNEWPLLSRVYRTPYFFDSVVIRNNKPVYVELDKIYRQKEQTFVDLLNRVRNNQMDVQSMELLNSHYKEKLSRSDYEENVTLTTHNRKADEINTTNLKELPGESRIYRSKVDGIFSEKNYPADENLELKVGAKVMFLKNNAERDYYNGKVGKITRLDAERIFVICDHETAETEVGREIWTNVAYKADRSSNHIEEEVLGTFNQFPLRLAWAITIHKSQGLTFDKVIIDAAEAFSAGQVYVALSRCRSLSGLTLSSKIHSHTLTNDQNIVSFSKNKQDGEQLNRLFIEATGRYEKNLLTGLFDFSEVRQIRHDLGGILVVHQARIPPEGKNWTDSFLNQLDTINSVALKFQAQLNNLTAHESWKNDKAMSERLIKAVGYFDNELSRVLNALKECRLVTESKVAAEEINEQLQPLYKIIFTRREELRACSKGFDLDLLLEARKKVTFPDISINVYAPGKSARVSSEVIYPQLYKKLLKIRDQICLDEGTPVYLVASQKTLIELTNFLPVNEIDLLQISGFGAARVEAYGPIFLKAINEYLDETGLESRMELKPVKKKKTKASKSAGDNDLSSSAPSKVHSREVTYDLFREGLSVEEIALKRNLALSTIRQHLLPYVTSGDISIDQLIPPEKQELIRKVLVNFKKEEGIKSIKNRLPEEISYADIHIVLADEEKKVS